MPRVQIPENETPKSSHAKVGKFNTVIRYPCKHFQNGCKKVLDLTNKVVHEEAECIYIPFSCPNQFEDQLFDKELGQKRSYGYSGTSSGTVKGLVGHLILDHARFVETIGLSITKSQKTGVTLWEKKGHFQFNWASPFRGRSPSEFFLWNGFIFMVELQRQMIEVGPEGSS